MIWKIAKKEFLLNLMTFKFAVGTILCVVLMAVFMPVLVNDYQQRLKDYNTAIAANEAELRKVRVYKNITPTIYRQPSVLSVFSEGLEKRLGNSAKIELDNIPEISAAAAKGNPYLSIYSVLDVSLIFKIVISVLALLVAYDVISGEREQGTLKLIMSSEIARYQVLLGKLLAGLMTLSVPVTIAFIVGLLILLSFPMVELTGSDWIRLGLMYFASLIFISAMYNFGLLFSCLTRSSAISLVLGLFLWIIFVVVIPNGSGYLARKIQPFETDEQLEGKLGTVREKLNSELKEIQKIARSSWSGSSMRGTFGGSYIVVCDERDREHLKKNYKLKEPVKIKYANRFQEVKQNYLNSLFKQKYLANNISRLSAISVYENVMSALAGTDLASIQHFTDRVKTHRNKTIEYIRSKTDNFSSLTYFIRYKEGDWEGFKKIGYPKWNEKKLAQTPPLDLQDFPKFTCRPDTIKSLQRAIPDLSLLLFINVLFFALSFVAFVRYDVRSD